MLLARDTSKLPSSMRVSQTFLGGVFPDRTLHSRPAVLSKTSTFDCYLAASFTRRDACLSLGFLARESEHACIWWAEDGVTVTMRPSARRVRKTASGLTTIVVVTSPYDADNAVRMDRLTGRSHDHCGPHQSLETRVQRKPAASRHS